MSRVGEVGLTRTTPSIASASVMASTSTRTTANLVPFLPATSGGATFRRFSTGPSSALPRTPREISLAALVAPRRALGAAPGVRHFHGRRPARRPRPRATLSRRRRRLPVVGRIALSVRVRSHHTTQLDPRRQAELAGRTPLQRLRLSSALRLADARLPQPLLPAAGPHRMVTPTLRRTTLAPFSLHQSRTGFGAQPLAAPSLTPAIAGATLPASRAWQFVCLGIPTPAWPCALRRPP